MSTVVVINPAVITQGELQTVSADLTKFDHAKAQSALVVVELAGYYTITSKESQATAMETLKSASAVVKAIETRRKDFVGPWNDEVKKVNNYAKELSAPIETAINKVKEACLQFQKEEEKKAKDALITQRQGQLAAMGFNFNGSSSLYTNDGVGTVTMSMIENYDAAVWGNLINCFDIAIKHKAEQLKQNLMEEQDLVEAFGTEEEVKDLTAKIAQADIQPQRSYAPPTNGQHVTPLKGITKRWTFNITDIALIPREYFTINEVAIRQAITAGVREIPGITIFQSESLTVR